MYLLGKLFIVHGMKSNIDQFEIIIIVRILMILQFSTQITVSLSKESRKKTPPKRTQITGVANGQQNSDTTEKLHRYESN